MNLNDLNIGDCARVLSIKGSSKESQYLLSMGVFPGAIINVVKKAPLGDPIEISIHGYNLAIRSNQAKNIIVEQFDSDNKDFYEENINDKSNLIDSDLYDFTSQCKNCKKNCPIKKGKPRFNPKSNAELLDGTQHPGLGETGIFHNKNDEPILPENKNICFALVGNQNSGKTTLFNALTGSNQHVGNFPGVTIDKKDGTMLNQKNTNITDLPGVYSLSPYSKEEVITRDFILNNDIDCIINIVDSTNMERSLYLTLQLIQLEHPMIIALNMIDELRQNNGMVLVNKLEKILGIPVVPISAKKKEGIEELVSHAIHIARYQELPAYHDFCVNDKIGGATHKAIHAIMHIISDYCEKDNTDKIISNPKEDDVKQFHKHIIPVRFAAEKLVEKDNSVSKQLMLDQNSQTAINYLIKDMEDVSNMDSATCIAKMRYRFILDLCNKCVIKAKESKLKKRSDNIDKILTGKYTGIPLFVCIMFAVFFLTFEVFGKFFQNLLNSGINFVANISINALNDIGANNILIKFIDNAIFSGIGTILGFMPIIIIMFFFLSLLEDSGYMARVAFVMDKLLRKIGLSGRSIVPLLIGFGCSVPAVMSTRTLPSEKDRKRTILLIPFTSCSAKLPIYALISSIFFNAYASLVMILLYIFGIVIGIIVALVTKGKGKPVPFIMELPNYRVPTANNVLHLMWDKTKDFIQRAFTVILIATIIVWFLQSFNFEFTFIDNPQESILSSISGTIAPIFSPIGLGDWKIVTSFISGFLAKESVISTLLLLTGSTAGIMSLMNIPMAISFLVFTLIYTPCIATISAINRELGFKWSIFVVIFQCFIAWICSFIIYNIFVIM